MTIRLGRLFRAPDPFRRPVHSLITSLVCRATTSVGELGRKSTMGAAEMVVRNLVPVAAPSARRAALSLRAQITISISIARQLGRGEQAVHAGREARVVRVGPEVRGGAQNRLAGGVVQEAKAVRLAKAVLVEAG
jgi:hypothetical protein